MENNGLDPETEKALRDAMSQAEKDVRNDGVKEMAAYMRRTYLSFRQTGFGRAQAYLFTVLLYRSLIRRG